MVTILISIMVNIDRYDPQKQKLSLVSSKKKKKREYKGSWGQKVCELLWG